MLLEAENIMRGTTNSISSKFDSFQLLLGPKSYQLSKSKKKKKNVCTYK